ncbi:MAG: amino acid adenylation domain-containing protein [Ruthenibacterium sp.]
MIRNVTDYLELAAAQWPDKAAVTDQNASTSFAQLRADARRIGTALAAREMLRRPVVVFLPKSALCLAAFLGAAYAGAFYTPIDTAMPAARMEKILQTLCPDVMLTSRGAADFIKNTLHFTGKVLYCEDLLSGSADDALLQSARAQTLDTDLLYVLVTSGSTGVPKGVCITHAAVINFAESIVPLFGITQHDTFGNQAAFYFDLSVMDIACMLRAGAEIYLIDPDLFAQPVELLRCIRDNHITAIAWVPSALVMVSKLRAFRSVDVSGTLNKVLFIGEVMPTKQFTRWQTALPNALFSNFYGPTEATVACTAYLIHDKFDDAQPLPIGTPLANYDVFLLDAAGARIPVTDTAAEGEICVRGVSVARGYYNNPQMTAAAFTQNPDSPAAPECIYHTGDWAKYSADGALLYIGRHDFQIKHLGHRIELGEVEAAASSLHGVSACCCVHDEKRDKLVLFCEGRLAPAAVTAQLKTLVPHYMCPNRIVPVAAMPLNANGKMDRAALKALL